MFWDRTKVEEINPEKLYNWVKNSEDIVILDVRTPKEWEETGVIPDSIMIPTYKVMDELERGLNLNNSEKVVVVCRTGRRSKNITKELTKKDINAFNLKHGIKGWKSKNYELEEY